MPVRCVRYDLAIFKVRTPRTTQPNNQWCIVNPSNDTSLSLLRSCRTINERDKTKQLEIFNKFVNCSANGPKRKTVPGKSTGISTKPTYRLPIPLKLPFGKLPAVLMIMTLYPVPVTEYRNVHSHRRMEYHKERAIP